MNYIDSDGQLFFLAAPVIYGMAIGAVLDVGFQLIENGGQLSCINWRQAGLGAALGAIPGGVYMGAFKHSGSGKSWLKASRKFKAVSKRLHRLNGTSGRTANSHHWAIPHKGWGRNIPNFIKNHPWNINPVSPERHHQLHYAMGPLSRFFAGSPDWARGAMAGLAATPVLPNNSDECVCK